MYRVTLSTIALSLALTTTATACTSVVFKDGDALLFARNFDWAWGDGMVVVNQREIAKTAFVRPDENPAAWTSEFGSVTFNQWGREMPYGGINEAGLVIAQMMLMESEYAAPDDRPAVNMLQWIQYQLDNCNTLDEVKVAQGPATVWSLVYDIPARRVYFRTFDKAELRWFDLDDFDFSPDAPPMFLDINAPVEGQVADRFRELTEEQHTEQLMAFFGKPDVQERFGKLDFMVTALNGLLKTYRPAATEKRARQAHLVPATIGSETD